MAVSAAYVFSTGFTTEVQRGKGKVFVNYARFLEAPIPVSLNQFAGGTSFDLDALVNRLNAPSGSTVDFGKCCDGEPVAPGLKPQTLNETDRKCPHACSQCE